MNGLTIPLNLDLAGFEKSMEQARKRVDEVSTYIMSNKGSTKRDDDPLFAASKELAKNFRGTAQEYKEALRSLEALSDAINIKNKEGGDQLVMNYNHWVDIRRAMGDASVNFQQLYNMQLEYTKLTGKEFEIKDLSDISKLEKEVQFHKDYLKLLDEEAKATEKANKEKANSDRIFYEQKQKAIDEADKINRARRTAESKRAFDDHFKSLTDYEKYLENEKRLEEKRAAERKNLEKKAADNVIKERNRVRQEITNAFNDHFDSIEKLNESKKKLTSTADGLMKKLAVVFSLRQIQRFSQQVIKIGGDLERQRVALGAIVKDLSTANTLFSQLKKQSLESPFSFKELIRSTRELAAYNIETEKLKDSQFMLSELSAGLGVDVSRLILAYGQVRAAAVLRGQELRQFTEAGIPILDALADKFSMVENRVVSVGEVFEKVSQRMVSFQMVHDVLQDMTEEGGKFFEMQKVQAETIYGQWKIISDAKDIMFQDIAVAMEKPIMAVAKSIRFIFENWRGVGVMFGLYAGAFAAHSVYQMIVNRDLLKSHAKEILLMDIKILKRKEELGLTLAQNTALKAATALSGGLYTLAAAGLTLIGAKIINAATEMSRFRKQIDKINTRIFDEFSNAAGHLDRLIKSLANYNQGSVGHKEILEKINSKYGEYIPLLISEKTTMEELVAVYDVAVDTMKRYNSEKSLGEAMAKLEEDKSLNKRQEALISTTKRRLEMVGVAENDAARLTNLFVDSIRNAIAQGNEIKDYAELLRDLADGMGLVVNAEKVVDKDETHGILYKFANNLKKKLQYIIKSNDSMYDSYSESIRNGLLQVEKAYSDGISSINDSSMTDLEKSLARTELERRKKLAETAVRSTSDMTKYFTRSISDLSKEERTAAQNEASKGLATYIDNVFKHGIDYAKRNFANLWTDKVKDLARDSMKGLSDLGKDGFDSFTAAMGRRMDKVYDIPEVQKVLSTWRDEQMNLIPKVYKDVSKTEQYAILLHVKTLTENFKSLEDAYDNMPKAYEEQIERIENERNLLRKNEQIWSKETVEAKKKEIELNKKYARAYREAGERLGIDFDKNKGGSGGTKTDPRIEQSKRLIQIYNEMYNSYKKYAEYMGKEDAATQTIREHSISWDELNVSMGGILGNIQAITSQTELLDLLDKARSVFAGTPQAVKAITDALVKNRSLQELDKAKKSLEEVNNELKDVEDKFQLGKDLDVLQEGMLFQIPEEFKEHTLTTEEYKKALGDLIETYNSMGDKGVEKALELSLKLQKMDLVEMKDMALETIRIKNELMDLDEKIAYQERMLTQYQALLEEETNEVKKENLKAHIEQTTRFLDDLKSDKFRASSLYEILYGDIEKHGLEAQKLVIKQLKQLLEKAKKETPDYNGYVNITYYDEDGNIQQTKIKLEQIIRELVKLEKLERKVDKSKPFDKLKENLSKIKETIVDVNDGTEKTVINTDALGEVFEEIGNNVSGIGNIFSALGFDEAGEVISEIGNGIDAIGGLIASGGADIGSWVALVESFMSLFGDELFANIKGTSQWYARQLENNAKAVRMLEREYNKLNRAIEETIRLSEKTDAYKQTLEVLQKQKDVAAQNVELAKEQYNQLLRSHDKIKKLGTFVIGGSKKRKKAKEEIEKMEDEYIEASNRLDDELKKIVEEFGANLSSVADTFADNWIRALEEVGTGVGSLDESFDDLFKGIAKKQISEAILKPMLAPLIKYINSIVDTNSDGGLEITDSEASGLKQHAEETKKNIKERAELIDSILETLGVSFDGKGKDFESLQKGIQGITENTAEVIASYLNSVRIEVVTIRTILEGGAVRSNIALNDNTSSIMLQYYPQYLDNLIAINENTSYLKNAYEPSKRALRMA